MTPARVLVVDDSVVIRRLLTDILAADPDIEVIGTASNGRLGLDRIRQLNPDLVTLDIEMPELNGLETLVELRKEFPKLPVIMFSTLTERGGAATIEALANGANDYVTKPANVGSTQAAISQVRDDLIPRVKALTGRTVLSSPPPPAARPVVSGRRRPTPVSLVAIGTSTGGPNALEAVLGALAPAFPVPVVIVQHMPATFTRLLAERLDQKTHLDVVEASDGDRLRPGCAYLAPGGLHMEIHTGANGDVVRLTEADPENFCRPAVDVLFRSVAVSHGAGVLGLVMTGMGQDGLIGARALVEAGAEVLAQDEATSVVWGMPGYIAREGIASDVLAIEDIAPALDRKARRAATGTDRVIAGAR